ncbi:PKD domain-containing protein [Zobellia amurskyensis]|uniref:PKD domain-containing protein n=1 Tax=Zobellia amurskyensis TaxID=248905 RepID=A0A7X3D0P1_9FLAO|nr:PKD domain-containing protein [Zobellia amurskyensis]MUH34653.1 PKD domain-containing protein [Zobellia amurskyensis]
MRNKHTYLFSAVLFSVLLTLVSCNSDDDSVDVVIPLTADIFHSVNGKKVNFQGLTNNAVSWAWDFGDGTKSTDKNPVHTFSDGGYYVTTLTATGQNGSVETTAINLAIDLPAYSLLVGNHTLPDYQGKKWRIKSAHSNNDYFANSDAVLSPFDGAPNPLPSGIFGAGLGMPEVYEDEFTFHFDGTYEHDVKSDGAAFSGLVYQFVTTGGAGIVNDGGSDFGLCTGKYTPDDGATFTYVENEDFKTTSVYGPEGSLIYSSVSTLDFSGTEFIGLLDFERKVIIQDITDSAMRLVMFVAASPDAIGLNTNAIVLTFEVAN